MTKPIATCSCGLKFSADALSCGMTLRDWFAGQVLAALIHCPGTTYVEAACDAYMIADAVMREREK